MTGVLTLDQILSRSFAMAPNVARHVEGRLAEAMLARARREKHRPALPVNRQIEIAPPKPMTVADRIVAAMGREAMTARQIAAASGLAHSFIPPALGRLKRSGQVRIVEIQGKAALWVRA